MEINKYFQNYMFFIVKIDVFRKILNGTTPKTETLKLVFAYFILPSRRCAFWLEFSISTCDTFTICR